MPQRRAENKTTPQHSQQTGTHTKKQPRKIGSIRFTKNPTSKVVCLNVYSEHCKIQSTTQKYKSYIIIVEKKIQALPNI